MSAIDYKVKVRFYPTEDGGRKFATPPGWFRCIIGIVGRFHDCAIRKSDNSKMTPGETIDDAYLKVLSIVPLPRAELGTEFTIIDGKEVAKGTILEIVNLENTV